MKLPVTHIFVLASFLAVSICYGQDSASAPKAAKGTSAYTYAWSPDTEEFYVGMHMDPLYHSDDKEYRKTYRKYRSLISKQPDEKNYNNYFKLALALWEIDSTKEAEKLLLSIERSNMKQYVRTYRLSSDVPGDTSTNLYEYGSCTYNYKNEACIYLARVYLENKQYAKAYKYTVLADSTYKIYYTCSTGNAMYRDEMEGLYSACYEGLGNYKEFLRIQMPHWYYHNDKLPDLIKKIYTKEEIKKYLDTAESTLTFKLNDYPSTMYYTANTSDKNSKTDTITYTSGLATMRLFGVEVDFPEEELKNGGVATKEYYIRFLHRNYFYKELKPADL